LKRVIEKNPKASFIGAVLIEIGLTPIALRPGAAELAKEGLDHGGLT